MELHFNELSENPIGESIEIADEKMQRFIKMAKAALNIGVTKIRSENTLDKIKLTEELSVQEWLFKPENKSNMDFLYGLFIHPFLDIENQESFEKYDRATYTFDNEEHNINAECLGLAAAYIYEQPSASFSGFKLWESNSLEISITIDGEFEKGNVLNISSDERFDEADIQQFLENYGDLNLPETAIEPLRKKYHIAPHHGEKELTELCKKLIHSPYVVEMRSMEWCKGKCNNFIKRFHKNGVIEIVLIDTVRKYGLWVQSTGTNFRQTKAISELLEERYC
ncbi:hypothetical protein CAP35_12390 [Chitinophagaceae bacterium IBVUCB1]|nr:hypothetical protein CAP35_12390 [Chitinophagaceae bacterium IBVUCB1]